MNFSFDKEIILESSFVLLRPVKETDLDDLLPIATKDKDLLQFSPTPIYSKDLLKIYIDKALENRIKTNHYTFIVFDKTQKAYAEPWGETPRGDSTMHNAARQVRCFERWHICLPHIPARHQSKQKSQIPT